MNWDLVATIAGPLISFFFFQEADKRLFRWLNADGEWRPITSWHLPSFFIWTMPLGGTIGAVSGTISAWGEKSATWSAVSVLTVVLLAALTARAFHYRFFRYVGKEQSQVGAATQDWRSNPESAKRRYEQASSGRWAVWVLALFAIGFFIEGVATNTLGDPQLWLIIGIPTAILVLRWILLYRLRTRMSGPETGQQGEA